MGVKTRYKPHAVEQNSRKEIEDLKRQLAALQQRYRASTKPVVPAPKISLDFAPVQVVVSVEPAPISSPSNQNPSSKLGSPGAASTGGSPGRQGSKDPDKSSSLGRTKAGRVTKQQPRPRSNVDSRGLFNSGENWCYRNSMLQVLLHQPSYLSMLKEVHQSCDKPTKTECVICILKFLATAYWRPKNEKFRRRNLAKALDKALRATIKADDLSFGEEVHHGGQSCPFDFMIYCIQEILRGGRVLRRELTTNLQDPAHVDALLDLQIEGSWKCQFCDRVHEEAGMEPTPGLSLKIDEPRQGLTLDDYITNALDRNDGAACASECEQTRVYRDAHPAKEWPKRRKVNRIIQSPETLLIQLQRTGFRSNADGMPNLAAPYKIDTDVEYDEYLDLSEHTADGSDLFYRLDGVISHGGDSLNAGHYVAWVRLPNHKGFNLCNDEQVERLESVQNLLVLDSVGEDEQPHQAYVLVYSKCQ